MGVGSCDYGGWEVSPSAVRKLENQGSWWPSRSKSGGLRVILSPWPENLGSGHWSKSWNPNAGEPGLLMSNGRRRWVSQLQEQEREREPTSEGANTPFLRLTVLSRPLVKGVVLTTRLSQLVQMPVSSGNTVTDKLRNNALPAVRRSLNSVKLTPEINHHTSSCPNHWQHWDGNVLCTFCK